MLNIVLTFDYELFFGENNRGYEEILFNPTEKLIKLFYEKNVSAVFFMDICSLIQARKYKQDKYAEGFENQLKKMVDIGQDVQLHIHPHWLNSSFVDNKWIFDNAFYRIHSFGFESNKKTSANSIIKEGIEHLTALARQVNGDYQCIAYRAGGFCIQPHAELIKVLYDEGIRIDSSITPQMKSSDDTHEYNYCRKGLASNWWISDQKEWWEDAPNDVRRIFEVPVGTINKNPFVFMLKKLVNPESIKLTLEEKRGTYIESGKKQNENRILNVWNYINGYNSMSMDAYRAEYLYAQLKKYCRIHNCRNGDAYIALIGHPKLITDNYIDNLKKLIDYIEKDNILSIVNTVQIYEKEKLNLSNV